MKQLDAVMVFPPPMDRIDRVYAAPHFLSTYLNSKGFHTAALDLNLDVLFELATSFIPDHQTSFLDLDVSPPASARDLMAMETEGTRYTRVFQEPYKKMFGRFYTSRTLSARDILNLAKSPEMETMTTLVQETLVRDIAKTRAPLVGFSIPFSQQLAPAAALAGRIKQLMGRVHICFGGPIITLLNREILDDMQETLPVDSFVKYEGERPLARLIHAVKNNPLAAVPRGVLSPDPLPGKPSRMTENSQTQPAVYDHCRFGHKVLEQMPRKTKLPVLQSTGCYWQQCTFCDYINLHRDKTYRPRKTRDILSDIRYYTERGFFNFRLLAEAVPPPQAVRIAHAILDQGLDINWHAFIRVDKNFTPRIFEILKKSGFSCTVGMESASTRVLKRLNKGYDRAVLNRFVAAMNRAGFGGNHLNIMVGVPGETWEDALETLAFCSRCQKAFAWFKPSRFTLTATSDMGRHPENYGIRVLEPGTPQGPDMNGGRLTSLPFEDPKGMSETQISAVFQAYQRLNRSVEQKKPGNGTGIATLFRDQRDEPPRQRTEMAPLH